MTAQEQENIRAIVDGARVLTKDMLRERLDRGDIVGAIFHADRFERAAAQLTKDCDPPEPQPIQLGWS